MKTVASGIEGFVLFSTSRNGASSGNAWNEGTSTIKDPGCDHPPH